MLPDHQYDAIRFEEFCNSVLKPLAYPNRLSLSIEVAPFSERVPFAQARVAPVTPVQCGHRWGPIWSTLWFRLTGSLPSSWKGQRVVLRFSSGTESTLWMGDRPFAGFDPYHDMAPILPMRWTDSSRATGDELVELWIEAACNLPLGATTFWWDQPELRARWNEEKPGRVEFAELCVFDEEMWQFAEHFDALRRLLTHGPAPTARSNQLLHGLRSVVNAIPSGLPGGNMRDAVMAQQCALAELVRGDLSAPSNPARLCVAVGHAHIDTAWLWRIDETRRKCLRSFSTALRNIERFPHFHFLCSQAQQYAFVEEESPAVFEEIKNAVRDGRWEPNGAMWVEPDCTAPSGESFIRQIEHGTRWWRERFGESATQRFLYLPDTFGFPACLPQIIEQAGLDTFITNKIAWNDTNRFPHVNFRWRGLDGTEILTHLTPGHNYNSELDSRDILAGANIVESLDKGRIGAWLQPFGWGDGGGGPDPTQIERAELFAECAGVPRTTQGRADSLCDHIHALAQTIRPLPVWDGDLYLEAHRGTYTSQRWIKQANRKAERLLRRVEMLAVMAQVSGDPLRTLLDELDGLWKTVLLHQFHDILPGSSIGAVYADARVSMGRVLDRLDALEIESLYRLRHMISMQVGERIVFNSASVHDFAHGCLDDGDPVPPCAVAVVRDTVGIEPVDADLATRTLSNGLVQVSLDHAGRIESIVDVATGVAVGCLSDGDDGPLNQLMLYEDRPRRWEAWDLDRDFEDKPTTIEDPVECSLALSAVCEADGAPVGTLGLVVRRSIGSSSSIEQRFEVSPGERMVRVRTKLQWHEERTLLRVLFPTGIRARMARVGTQFGFLDHSTHRNTSWDAVRYEIPGHDWMEISQEGRCLAILDDGIFGRSLDGGTMGLSLVRSPNFPDPQCDRGEHTFTYALLVGDGSAAHEDHRHESATSHADRLNNQPCIGIATKLADRECVGAILPRAIVPVRILGGDDFGDATPLDHPFEISALKPAQDGSGDVILRIVERCGSSGRFLIQCGFPVGSASRCDVHEQYCDESEYEISENDFIIETTPFQILSLRIVGQ